MARGGKRIGSGRPHGTGKFGEPTKPIRVPLSDLDRAIKCVQNRFFRLPLYQCPVTAGVPSAVDDKVEKNIARAAFGNDFAIRKTTEVFLPVYSIVVQNPDGLAHDHLLERPQWQTPAGAPNEIE